MHTSLVCIVVDVLNAGVAIKVDIAARTRNIVVADVMVVMRAVIVV